MASALRDTCGISLATMCLMSSFGGQTSRYPIESASGLVEQFESTTAFWKQFDVAKKIVALHDKSVLPPLEPWLGAAHLLGDLKDPRAVPILVPLLKDEEVNLIVPWSLGEIGDKSAIPPLIEMLGDSRLEMRAAVLRALEKLEANECRPPLRQIEDGCTIAVNPQRLPVQSQRRSLARLPGVEASTNFGGNVVL